MSNIWKTITDEYFKTGESILLMDSIKIYLDNTVERAFPDVSSNINIRNGDEDIQEDSHFACSRYKLTQGRDLVANGEAELTEKVKRRFALTK